MKICDMTIDQRSFVWVIEDGKPGYRAFKTNNDGTFAMYGTGVAPDDDHCIRHRMRYHSCGVYYGVDKSHGYDPTQSVVWVMGKYLKVIEDFGFTPLNDYGNLFDMIFEEFKIA